MANLGLRLFKHSKNTNKQITKGRYPTLIVDLLWKEVKLSQFLGRLLFFCFRSAFSAATKHYYIDLCIVAISMGFFFQLLLFLKEKNGIERQKRNSEKQCSAT